MKKVNKTKAAGVMTEPGNVKTTTEPAPKESNLSVNEEAKQIEKRSKSADVYEFDDTERAKAIFAKLPEDEFVIKEGDVTVIQKL